MGLGGAVKESSDGEELVLVACSICFDAVKRCGDRSTARLQCGHEFHLDCIGSAFNAKGLMQCPNCRKVEEGNWLYANGSRPIPELTVDEWPQDEDIYNLSYIETSFGGHWCPFGNLARIPALFEEGESSPAITYQDLLGHHAMFSDNLATLPATHSCPFMSYTRVPQRPSFTNGHSVEMHSDGRGYRHQWSHFSRPRESQNLHTMTPNDLHYRGWEHHQAYSLLNEHINSAAPAGHSSRHEADGSPAAGSVFHPFTLSRGYGSRIGPTSSPVPSFPHHRNDDIVHEHYQLQHSQNAYGIDMSAPGSSRGFRPTELCGPFLISPTVQFGQTNAAAENFRSNRHYTWERECFAHNLFSPVDMEPSCWGPFLPTCSSSDSNPTMAFFPHYVSERSSVQARYNRSVPAARRPSLM